MDTSTLLRTTPTASAEWWEYTYRRGAWTYLAGAKEVSRYAVVAGYIRFYVRNGVVLDAGCGEGLLHPHLDSRSVSKYVGIDFSGAALQAARRSIPALFTQTLIDVYKPEEQFDAIVFNEVLYYMPDPRYTLTRYSSFLASNGIIIVSMYHNTRDLQLSKKCEAITQYITTGDWIILDITQVTNVTADLTWSIHALKPRAGVCSAEPADH